VHVHKIDDIASLLRLQEEFGIGVTVEHACDVNDGHIYALLKERGIPVVFGPMDAFAYKVELRHENWRNVRHLLESGVEFGLMTDHPVCRSATCCSAALVHTLRPEPAGRDRDRHTQERADPRNGRLPRDAGKGKWASFSCWNGDPFDITRYPVKVIAEGATLFEEG